MSGSINGSITLTNNSDSTQTGTGTTSSQFDFGALTGFTIPTPLFVASFSTGSQTLTAHETRVLTGLSGSNSATITNTTSFTDYLGAGTFPISVTTLTGLTITGGGGNFAASQTTQAMATAEVTYNFTSTTVPEPGTTMLVGGALLFLSLSTRRVLRRRL